MIRARVYFVRKPTVPSMNIFRRAFTRGMAQAFDLYGVIASRRLSRFRNRPGTARRALGSDWRAVSCDFARGTSLVWRSHGFRRETAS